MSLPALTGSGASVLETFSTGVDVTVVVAAAPATGAVSFESIVYEPFVMTVPFASGLFTRTTSSTEDDTPVLRAPIVQVTLPPAIVQPVLVITVPFRSGLFARTTSCTDPDAPALTAPMFQVTTPADSVPPPAADTKDVLAGSGSRRTTPVALLVPVFW